MARGVHGREGRVDAENGGWTQEWDEIGAPSPLFSRKVGRNKDLGLDLPILAGWVGGANLFVFSELKLRRYIFKIC